MPDLNRDALLQALSDSRLGQPLHLVDELGSTSDLALELARQGAPHGCLVIARRQTAGRGRRGHSWWHDPVHGLALSLVLRPDWPARRAPDLVHLAALAAHDALEAQGVEVGIKWPNDLVVDTPGGRRKLAGILVQSSARSARLEHAVLGLGINVNTPGEALPGEAGAATSLTALTGRQHHRVELVATFCARLAYWIGRHGGNGLRDLMCELRERSVLLGEQHEVEIAGQRVRVQVDGLDQDGALLVTSDDGVRHRLLEPLPPIEDE